MNSHRGEKRKPLGICCPNYCQSIDLVIYLLKLLLVRGDGRWQIRPCRFPREIYQDRWIHHLLFVCLFFVFLARSAAKRLSREWTILHRTVHIDVCVCVFRSRRDESNVEDEMQTRRRMEKSRTECNDKSQPLCHVSISAEIIYSSSSTVEAWRESREREKKGCPYSGALEKRVARRRTRTDRLFFRTCLLSVKSNEVTKMVSAARSTNSSRSTSV